MSSFALETDEGIIRGRKLGRGEALVLLSTMGGIWHGQIRALGKRYTVVTYDMRGFGQSSGSGGGFPTNDAHARDLRAVLDGLGLDRVVLVGLSHGGLVAQRFALAYPERLRGLVITSSLAKASGSALLFLRMLIGLLEGGDLSVFWHVLRSFLIAERHLERVGAVESRLRQVVLDRYTRESLENIYRGALEHDCLEELPGIRAPTLIIGGEEDMLFPPRFAAELAEQIPRAGLRLLPTAHVPPLEAPELFNDALDEFMAAIASGG